MKIKYLISLPIVSLTTLLFAPATGSAQILLTAGNFALLGGTAVSNSGTSIITGNIGAGTAISGFPPGVVVGTEYVADTVTNQAELDLITASNGLYGMPTTTGDNIVSGELGGLTLLPGVYTFSPQSAALDGTLTLNANGEANAVWVFNIYASLTTSEDSSVVLENTVNNGSGVGVYWNAYTGGITIGANSTVLGNYLAGTSVTFDGLDSGLGGRLLAQAAVSISTASDFNSTGNPGGSGYDAGLMYNPQGAVVPIPEPAAFLWLAPLGALGLVVWRRRFAAQKIAA
jgi:hypothetical protein